MPDKPYKISEEKPLTVEESAIAYKAKIAETPVLDSWNPNVPFHGTQAEWWEHFHNIEKGEFSPASDAHKRISQYYS
jgi:hypothetical protein